MNWQHPHNIEINIYSLEGAIKVIQRIFSVDKVSPPIQNTY
jgi:hypothetical protein